MIRTADRFSNRSAAGRLLADKLAERAASYRAARPLVLALPRGGLLVGVELARALATPLDVLVARRIWAPGQPQLAIGAVAPGGVCVLFEERIAELGISPRYVELVAAEVTLEVELATERYRAGYPPLELGGRTVIVVEDGLASGATAAAALERPAEKERVGWSWPRRWPRSQAWRGSVAARTRCVAFAPSPISEWCPTGTRTSHPPTKTRCCYYSGKVPS